jgi:hypothetical protein
MTTQTQQHNEIRDDARTVFQRHLELLSSGRVEEWVQLFAEDGSIEHPFAPGEYASRMTGHADLLTYVSVLPKLFAFTFSEPSFHDTVDPSLVIAEFTSTGTGLPLESINAVGDNLPD